MTDSQIDQQTFDEWEVPVDCVAKVQVDVHADTVRDRTRRQRSFAPSQARLTDNQQEEKEGRRPSGTPLRQTQ
jgi:hypothetical protein